MGMWRSTPDPLPSRPATTRLYTHYGYTLTMAILTMAILTMRVRLPSRDEEVLAEKRGRVVASWGGFRA